MGKNKEVSRVDGLIGSFIDAYRRYCNKRTGLIGGVMLGYGKVVDDYILLDDLLSMEEEYKERFISRYNIGTEELDKDYFDDLFARGFLVYMFKEKMELVNKQKRIVACENRLWEKEKTLFEEIRRINGRTNR